LTTATRKRRPWSETEKLGALVIAVREGVPEASRRLKVPQTTLYTWLQAAGGVGEVRRLASMRAEEALSVAERAVYDEVARRMTAQAMGDDQLMITFRALVDARREGGGTQQQAQQAQASAHVWNINVSE
jgi:hypothetical protein